MTDSTEIRCHVVEQGVACGGPSLAPPGNPDGRLVMADGSPRVEGMCRRHALESVRRDLARLAFYEVQLMYLEEDQGQILVEVGS